MPVAYHTQADIVGDLDEGAVSGVPPRCGAEQRAINGSNSVASSVVVSTS